MIKLGRQSLPNEVAAQLFFDRERRRYFLYVPDQRQSPGGVVFERSSSMEQKHTLIADLHTHDTMPAFFSPTDDRDEMGWRIFIVLGQLDKEIPECKIRVGANGSFLDLSDRVGQLFDGDVSSRLRIKHLNEGSDVWERLRERLRSKQERRN